MDSSVACDVVPVADMDVVAVSFVFEELPHPASEIISPMVIEMVVIIFLNSFAFIQSPPFGRVCFLFYANSSGIVIVFAVPMAKNVLERTFVRVT